MEQHLVDTLAFVGVFYGALLISFFLEKVCYFLRRAVYVYCRTRDQRAFYHAQRGRLKRMRRRAMRKQIKVLRTQFEERERRREFFDAD